MKPGVTRYPNHDAIPRLGVLVQAMPPSGRDERRELLRRFGKGTRVPGGAFAKNGRPRLPIDPRQPLTAKQMREIAARKAAR